MRPTTSSKRPLEPNGDDDVVCGLQVCDGLHVRNAHVDDADEKVTDEMTGAPLLHDYVAETGVEEMAGYDEFEAYEEVMNETCLPRTGRTPISC